MSEKREIKNFSGYWITSEGMVWSDHSNKFIVMVAMPNGYQRVVLSKNNKSYNFLIHRLVAEAFIPNPDNKPCINHKDLNRANNCVENLEWVTYKENNNYLNHGKKNGAAHKKKVGQYDKQTGKLIKIYDGLIDAAQAVGGKQTNIGACCNNRPHYLSAYGYKWKFIGGDEE